MRATVYIATSVDGFIARPDGGIDWLDDAPEELPAKGEEDYGFQAFIDTVDVLVMGSHTYEKTQEYPDWPYGSTRVVVLSSRQMEIPEKIAEHVEVMSGTPEEIVERLGEQGADHLYIDGGITVQQFLRAGLIQRIIITRIPVLIGEGISLFGKLEKDIKLLHIETRSFDDGLAQSEYKVVE